MTFEFNMPTRLIHGPGCRERLSDELPPSLERILIVTDGGLVDCGLGDRIAEQLEGRDRHFFSEVEPNPSFETVDAGGKLARANDTQLVIGLGGGSPMDAAKGIAALATNPEIVCRDLVSGRELDRPALPIICLPTTSGTGSEVTPFAVFSDRAARTKLGCAFPSFYPVLALVDPELTYSMPVQTVIDTGLDVLTHAVEAYLSTVATPIGDLFALDAIQRVHEHLPQAAKRDEQAMSEMALAATQAGVAIAHASTILPHVMGYPLTVEHGVPHGRASTLALVPFFEYLRERDPRHRKAIRIEKLFEPVGGLRSFVEKLGVATDLATYGVDRAEIADFVPKVIVKSDLEITPFAVGEAEIAEIYALGFR